MDENSKELNVIKSIISGISDMISIISENAESQTSLNNIKLQGEDIRKQIKRSMTKMDEIRTELTKLQDTISALSSEQIKSKSINKIITSTNSIESVLEDIEVAKKKLTILSALYNDLSHSLHSSNQISAKINQEDSEQEKNKLAYEMSLDELDEVVDYFKDICKHISFICYELESTSEQWNIEIGRVKITWTLSPNQKAQWNSVKNTIKDTYQHCTELVKQFSTLYANTSDNVNQWKSLLNLYHL